MVHLNRIRLPGTCLLLLLAMTGCCQFDAELHSALTTTKMQLVGDPAGGRGGLYDRFDEAQLPAELDQVRRDVEHVHNLAEQQKSRFCWEIPRQGQAIKQMFDRHVSDRESRGPWNQTQITNAKENMAEAFDIAIRTLEAQRH